METRIFRSTHTLILWQSQHEPAPFPVGAARIDPMTALRQNKLERSTGQPAKVRNTSHDPV